MSGKKNIYCGNNFIIDSRTKTHFNIVKNKKVEWCVKRFVGLGVIDV